MSTVVSKKTIRIAALATVAGAAVFALKPSQPEPAGFERQLTMQAGFIQSGKIDVQPIAAETDVAGGAAALTLPVDPATPPFLIPAPLPVEALPSAVVTRADANPALQSLGAPVADVVAQSAEPATSEPPACMPDYAVTAVPGGMAHVAIEAPCHAGHTVMLAHAGLAIDETVPESGRVSVSLPVLDTRQPFTATLDDGLSAQATLSGASATAFDHVVLQWQGSAGFQLHALEFGADYGAPGHIWAGNPQEVLRGIRGEGGFLLRLGDPAAGGVAEVYSFPVGQMGQSGAVSLTVEAEITAKNCATDIAGQVLQRGVDGGIVAVDVTFAMPDCDAVGDILVLKNILQGLKIAAN